MVRIKDAIPTNVPSAISGMCRHTLLTERTGKAMKEIVKAVIRIGDALESMAKSLEVLAQESKEITKNRPYTGAL